MNGRINSATSLNGSSSGAIAAEIRRQQQILLVRQVPLMMFVNMVNAALVTAVLSVRVPLWQLGIWMAIVFIASAIQLIRWFPLRNRPPPARAKGRLLREAKQWSAFMGLVWGSTVIVFFTPDSIPHQMFLAVVVAGMAAGAVSLLQPMPGVCFSYLVPILAPLTVRFTIEGDEVHLAVAVMSLLFFVALIHSSRRSYHRLAAHVESSLELERAQSNLVDAIESINDAFAIYDGDGRVKLTNKRFRTWFDERRNLSEIPGTGGLYRMPWGAWIRGSVRPMTQGGYVSVHTDVSELKNRERELVTAKRQAEEANQAKSQFLANMSHELRTPLNAIMGFSQMMRNGLYGPLGSDKYKQYVADIHDSAAHLLGIINEILNLSKIESATYELSFKEVDISELIQWVLGVCTHQMSDRGTAKVSVQISSDFGRLRVDARALKQVLLNLLHNALKFTPPSGRVDVKARINEAGQPCILVADTGIGIPRGKLEEVRQPFRQVESVFQRKFRGTGLGLSISEALVRLHGGELVMESKKGRGTRVLIVLPAELRVLNRGAARAS